VGWTGDEPLTFLVYLAQSQLSKSRYQKDIESLQLSHTASGSSFISLDDLCQGLECLDKLRGLPYGGGGAAHSSKVTPTGKLSPPVPTSSKKSTSVGFVAQVQDADPDTTPLEMRKDTWASAINLLEEKVNFFVVCSSVFSVAPMTTLCLIAPL
jgi:hypothetical protein